MSGMSAAAMGEQLFRKSPTRGKSDRLKAAAGPTLIATTVSDSAAWMRRDLVQRVLPFGAAVLAVWGLGRPRWLGMGAGRRPAQLGFGLAAGTVLFPAALAVQLLLTHRVRGAVKVPAGAADAVLQAGYYALNAVVEEAFFRGLLQSGLSAALGRLTGPVAGTAAYVLYHRLGGWAWPDVLATALIGVPLAVAYRSLPGPPSVLGVSLAHWGATCGFLGPGPLLARRLGLL
jgi:membrane protease YdiL (CAAX protease family)